MCNTVVYSYKYRYNTCVADTCVICVSYTCNTPKITTCITSVAQLAMYPIILDVTGNHHDQIMTNLQNIKNKFIFKVMGKVAVNYFCQFLLRHWVNIEFCAHL